MPNSLRTKFKHMYHKCRIDEMEYHALIKKLDGHNRQLQLNLLDNVMQKQRTIITDDGIMYKVVLLKDIEKMKEEVTG